MSQLANFVWSIADQLRGAYKPHQYGDVILPMTILRRLDCILEPNKAAILDLAAKNPNPDRLAHVIKRDLKLPFFNTSKYTLKTLLTEPDQLRPNLTDYISGFSSNIIDIFERFKFDNELITLEDKDRLFIVVRKFSEVDLHPDTLSNADMGDLFEELIRKFADASNETAGEHFTPRDAIRLMVEVLFAADSDALASPGTVRTVYDPTAGTGGMLTIAEEHLRLLNKKAQLVLHGQEFNDQSYAICKSDMIAKGQDAANIRVGDTLADDLFAGKRFDYCMSNPPYGDDWKASEKKVRKEALEQGADGRFGHGLPDISDGQMLFLCHLVNKMRLARDGGGRAGIVLNGAPLFNGDAGSGPSDIRKWLIESDLVDAIIALPTGMFYNTGISTYIWILDNDKPVERAGRIQLIDGSGFYSKMRRNLGDKSRELSEQNISDIVRMYADLGDTAHSRWFHPDEFGYWKITVERPLRLNLACTEGRIETALSSKSLQPLADTLRPLLLSFGETVSKDRGEFLEKLLVHLKNGGVKLSAPQLKALWTGLGEKDPTGEPCRDSKGRLEPDSALREFEQVPFGADGQAARDATISAYVAEEVLPHVPDAWVAHDKTKVGYEIPLTRYFYDFAPPRPLEVIDAELNALVSEIITLLTEVEQR